MWELTNDLVIAVHGGGEGGGLVGALVAILSFIESLLQLRPVEIGAVLMPGLAGLPNLHPLVVHFPIALLSLSFLVDLAASLSQRSQWRTFAAGLLYLGAGFAAMTVLAGLFAAASVPHGDNVHDIMERHEHLGLAVLILAVALSAWRFMGKPISYGYWVIAAGLCGVLIITADLGGLMVYHYGVGVSAVDVTESAAQHQHETDTVEPIHDHSGH